MIGARAQMCVGNPANVGVPIRPIRLSVIIRTYPYRPAKSAAGPFFPAHRRAGIHSSAFFFMAKLTSGSSGMYDCGFQFSTPI